MTRTTLADIADARVAAAYEAAAEMLAVRLKKYSDETHNLFVQAGYDVFANRVKRLLDIVADEVPKTIRDLTPDNAKAALEAVRREARNEALREVAQELSDCGEHQAVPCILALIDKETTE